MRKIIFILLYLKDGFYLFQFVHGSLPDSPYGEETLHSYANELLKPLMSKTNDLNNTIKDYWNLYDKNMNNIESRFGALNLLSTNVKDIKNDTCKELQDIMANAQSTVDNATVILVQVLQKMAYTIDKAPSCATINVFTAVSCVAHKAQDVRNIYIDYKDQIVEKEIAAAKALNEILVEFINCLRRLG